MRREGFTTWWIPCQGFPRIPCPPALKALQSRGIIERRFYNEHPPRAEYTLTPKGRDLGPVVLALKTWGNKYRR